MSIENDSTRDILSKIRILNEEMVNGTQTSNSKEIKIQQNDQYFSDLKNNLQKFVGSVKTDDNSLIVYPEDNDVVFSAEVISMNNLKFQFRYNDQSGGLYVWTDSMLLTKDIVEKLGKLTTLKEQWAEYWGEHLNDYKK